MKRLLLHLQRGERTILPVTVQQQPAGSSFSGFQRQMFCVNRDSAQQLRQSLSFPKGTLMNRQLEESSELVQYFVWKSPFHILVSPHHMRIHHCHRTSQNLLHQLLVHAQEAAHDEHTTVKRRKRPLQQKRLTPPHCLLIQTMPN